MYSAFYARRLKDSSFSPRACMANNFSSSYLPPSRCIIFDRQFLQSINSAERLGFHLKLKGTGNARRLCSAPHWLSSVLFLGLPCRLLQLKSTASLKDFFCPLRSRWPLFSSPPKSQSPNSFSLPDSTSTLGPALFLSSFAKNVSVRKCFEI